MTEPSESRILIIYDGADREWGDRLASVLASHGMADRLELWPDGNRAGTNSASLEEYERAIEKAGVVVPLISPGFVNYQKNVERHEIHRSLEARGGAGSPVYPILLRPSDWEEIGWLNHITIYPEDGVALSKASTDEINARLALMALEIAARAFAKGILNPISAKVLLPDGAFRGMATFITSMLAVSVPQGDPTDELPRTLKVETGILTRELQATVEGRDASLDFCLLRLAPTSESPKAPPTNLEMPSPGSTWECLSFPWATSDAVFTTGTVLGMATRNGREYLHLRPVGEVQTPRGMSGAPIVIDGKLVAVLATEGTILTEWFALPLKSIATSPLAPTIWPSAAARPGAQALAEVSQSPAAAQMSADFNQAEFLSRLSTAARDSLARAQGLRTSLGQDRLHIEHLILGMYGRPDSPMRRHAREAGIYDLNSMLQFLSPWNSRILSTQNLVDMTPGILPIPFDSMPPLSAHVQRALAFAWEEVRRSGAKAVGRGHLMDGIFSVKDCSVVEAFQNKLPKQPASVDNANIGGQDWLPGVASDWPGEKDPDLLNLKRDVHAMCSVIAARDAALPLSIGLFGDWGSGKSFFMKEMQKKIKELGDKGPPSYCSSIVQLRFNAWHYIDTNLWASLTSEIFEGLATELSGQSGAEPENEAARILAQMSTSRDKLADAERKKQEAEGELASAQDALRQLRDEEAEIRAKLSSRMIFKQAVDLALQQDEVKEKLAAAAKELNLPEATAAGTELKNQLVEVQGLAGAIRMAMANTERLWVWLLAFLLVAISLFTTYHLLLPWARGLGLPDVVGHLGAVVAGIAALIAPFLNKARRAVVLLQEARARSEKLIKEEQDRQRKQLQRERDEKAKAVAEEERRVVEARNKVGQLEQKLRDLRADRQMFDFIKRRNESTDYTRHLGVIARAHKDFRELTAFLQRVKDEPAIKDLPRVERIVLYIDDLDRCPEKKVMDVLQAVHLLLAFPLFVVVVGVDPRWLLYSVSEHSPAFRSGSTNSAEFAEDYRLLWQSTPVNYMEKIFQVPFTLTPMTEGGFKNLVDELAKSKAKPRDGLEGSRKPESETSRKAGPRSETSKRTDAAQPGDEQTGTRDNEAVSQVKPTEQRLGADEKSETHVPTKGTKDSEAKESEPRRLSETTEDIGAEGPSPEPLQIEDWEREFMKRLHSLIPSPRAGKKFINLYRMLRTTVEPSRWRAFVGNKDSGEHRPVLLMLAILIGYPSEAAVIFRRLLERVHNETWWEFLESLTPEPNELRDTTGWAQLKTRLEGLRYLIADSEGCDVFGAYARQVARYSFQSGRVLVAQQLPATDD